MAGLLSGRGLIGFLGLLSSCWWLSSPSGCRVPSAGQCRWACFSTLFPLARLRHDALCFSGVAAADLGIHRLACCESGRTAGLTLAEHDGNLDSRDGAACYRVMAIKVRLTSLDQSQWDEGCCRRPTEQSPEVVGKGGALSHRRGGTKAGVWGRLSPRRCSHVLLGRAPE